MIDTAKDTYDLRPANNVQDGFVIAKATNELITAKHVQSTEDVEASQPVKDSSMDLKLAQDYQELKLKMNALDSQLREVCFLPMLEFRYP